MRAPYPAATDSGRELQALTPSTYATPLGLHRDIKPSTFTVGIGDRLIFYTDGLLEARDRAGRYFRLDNCIDTLGRPDLDAAADEMLGRLAAHTGRKLDEDVAMLLFEATSGQRPAGYKRSAASGRDAAPACGPRAAASLVC